MTDTGSIIAELRKEAGYTQKALAEALGITDKAVSKWERGLCLPDVSLLPKLSLLLGADIELLLAKGGSHLSSNWVGLLDLRCFEIDFSALLYDKPAVYYLLSHYLLLGITDIYVKTSKKNEEYLSDPLFERLGFRFVFDYSGLPQSGLMIMNRPCFLFGSDLTRHFQGAMLADSMIKLVPVNTPVPFLFCPAEYAFMYTKNPGYLYEFASERTLGRGMLCMDMGTPEQNSDISTFVRIYQNNTGLPVGSLEEIAYKQGKITREELLSFIENKPFCQAVRRACLVE